MSTSTDLPAPRRLRVGYLVAGLFFLGVAALWWLVSYDAIPLHALPYAVPLLLIVAGAVALVAQTASARRTSRASDPTPPTDHPTIPTEER